MGKAGQLQPNGYSSASCATLRLAGQSLTYTDLPAAFGSDLRRLPWVTRILAENVLRCSTAHASEAAAPFLRWLEAGRSDEEIPFYPSRVLMHDTTCVPALVDIAGMRDALAENGYDPELLNPVIPIDVSVDHSVAVDHFASDHALSANMTTELERNAERYRLMKWATAALPGVRVHPPGTGIMHTLNLEQLATVVAREERGDRSWAIPDTLIGTDSHTPMVNGIGVLGWGVGGLEAEGVIFGMPVTLRLPDVIGVRLTGRLKEGVLSTDLALAVTERLRQYGVSGEFVEFFGLGVAALTAGDRAVVANMAPEYGATTGFFPVDGNTLDYLEATGREATLIRRVEAVAPRQGLWFDPDAEPRYTDRIDIDLSSLVPSLAGPRRPQDRLTPDKARDAVEVALGRPLGGKFDDVAAPPDGAVAIAAITSCTNTTDPRLLVAAGLLARKARKLDLKPHPWVKTSLAPGSPAARRYLERAGLLDDLAALGFHIVGFGCTTCIGNSGPLVPMVEDALQAGASAVAVLSGNRNFPGRIHPDLDLGFLASPPLVIAFALAGDVNRNILVDPIASANGGGVVLADLWPNSTEIDAILAQAGRPEDFQAAFQEAAANASWRDLAAPATPLFTWSDESTYIRRPPFTRKSAGSRLGQYCAAPLLSLGDDITTDHISPAGQVPTGSEAAAYLTAHGDDPYNLNVFAARRGNFEAMVRGLFNNRSVRNLLAPDIPPGSTVHSPSGRVMTLRSAAQAYEREGTPLVIVAGERYGMGSSRDWAAKGVALLGVSAVLACGFERIHRTNLIGMGILPLILPKDRHPEAFRLLADDRLEIDAEASTLTPRGSVSVRIMRGGKTVAAFETVAAVETGLEVDQLQAGGIIPLILARLKKHVGGPDASIRPGARRPVGF